MEFLFTDWLGTPAWFWLALLATVAALTAFDLGVTFALIAAGIFYSLWKTRGAEEADWPAAAG